MREVIKCKRMDVSDVSHNLSLEPSVLEFAKSLRALEREQKFLLRNSPRSSAFSSAIVSGSEVNMFSELGACVIC